MKTCPQLFRLPKKQKSRSQQITTEVDIEKFHHLPPEGRKLTQDWARRSTDKITCTDDDSFEPFIYGWVAVNAWASCVTAKEMERDYLPILAEDPSLARNFQIALDNGLRPSAEEFQALWPIFRSMDVGIELTGGSRGEIVHEYRERYPEAAFKPGCFFKHRDESSQVPLDWPHTLSAIYQVRCNLFHGYKSLHSENDVRIVSRAFRVLAGILPMLVPGLVPR